jgi:hypothetical protein
MVSLDGGPVFYRHKRIGRDGKPFGCLKFRTMIMDWAGTLADIPDPEPFLIQSSLGYDWCLQHCFCKSHDYMKSSNTNDPFRSMQYGIELILVNLDDLPKLLDETLCTTVENCSDIFGDGFCTPQLFAQRSFRHQDLASCVEMSARAFDFRFGRVTETYSPKYNDYDKSGVSEEHLLYTPHPALLAELKLRPRDWWSSWFVAEDDTPAFCSIPANLGETKVIRRDLIEKFAASHNLKVVWRVWVEKDGGKGTSNWSGQPLQFARKSFIGFYFQENGQWRGKMQPFRS